MLRELSGRPSRGGVFGSVPGAGLTQCVVRRNLADYLGSKVLRMPLRVTIHASYRVQQTRF
jgi:hypothetical protein